MKSLTTLALLVGVLSAPALHSEEMPADSLPELNFPRSEFTGDDGSCVGKRRSAGFATRAAADNACCP